MPAIVAVPSPLSVKLTPLGRVWLSEIVRVGPDGTPVVVTVKLPACPTVKVVAAALVMSGATATGVISTSGALEPAEAIDTSVAELSTKLDPAPPPPPAPPAPA